LAVSLAIKDSSKLGAIGDISNLAAFNPFAAQTGAGQFSFGQGAGSFNENMQTQAMRQALNQQMAQGFGGGMLNDPNLQAAMQGNNIGGAMNQANQASMMGVMPGVDPSIQNFFNLGRDLGQGFDPRSPQDMSGGQMGQLRSAGIQNQMAAGDFTGLQNSELATMRAAAQPELDRQRQSMEKSLFAKGMLGGGSTQTGEAFRGLAEAQGQQDLGFQQEAFNRAAQRSSLLGNLGLGQTLGAQQNLIQNMMGANQLGSGALGQQFQQQFQGIGQMQSAGNQRLQNALNLFGVGQGAQQQGFGQGLQSAQQLQNMNQFGLTGILGLLNAEANRIGGTGAHAQALGQVGQNQGGFLGGIMGGIGDLFSDRRLKKNVKLVGTDEAGVNWYTWEWNSQAKLLGADKVAPFGVIAQEVAAQGFDHAVSEDPSGFLKVNYDMIGA
jgi:hypothetical protein